MPIFKIHNQTRFASIPNATLRDKRLSIESRGVLAYLLTHDDKFELSFVFLQKELGIGRDKLKNIVRELKQSGYLCLVAAHNKKGSFDGQEWFIFAEAQTADFTIQTFNRLTEKPSDVKTVRRENRQTQNPSDNIEENSSQKKILEEENKESLSPRLREICAEPENETVFKEFSPTLAIKVFREIFPTYQLGGQQREDFAAMLPEVEESVWRQNLIDWRTSGWKAQNISGMVKRYKKELKETQNGVNNGTNYSNYRETDRSRREREARERIEFDVSAAQFLESCGDLQIGGPPNN